jgi:hypothetical protein
MSNDEVTEKNPPADGTDCPAARPLCLCGVRGCSRAAEHAVSMRAVSTRRFRWRR